VPKAKTKTATANIRAVVGSDEARVKREAAGLAKQLAPAEAGEFGLEIIDGAADNVDGAANAIRSTIAALQTLPFFGGGKLVWLKSANFLSDDVKGKSVNVLEPLEQLGDILAGGLPDDVTFLVSAIDPDKRRSFYKTLTKLADTQIFDEPDLNRSGWEENAGEIVRAEAKKRGLEFEEEALELFVLSTGGDSGVVANELVERGRQRRGPRLPRSTHRFNCHECGRDFEIMDQSPTYSGRLLWHLQPRQKSGQHGDQDH